MEHEYHRLIRHTHHLFWMIVIVFSVSTGTLLAEDIQKPNVLLIAIDDLNDWVGCLGGHPQAKTPNIDRLAAQGMLFTNAHCQGPICGPSRASLLSGKYPHTTGVYQQPKKPSLKSDSVHFRGHLLTEYFAEHGYQTLGVGKITHGYDGKVAFQQYGGSFSGSGPKPPDGKRFNYFLPDVPYTGTQTDWGAFPEKDELMTDHRSATWAVEHLRQLEQENSHQPFFLAVGFIRPHVPFYVPEKWFKDFPLEEVQLPEVRNDDLEDVPEIGRAIHELPKYPRLEFLQSDGNLQFRKCVQAYLACTLFVDHQVGRVLDALEQSSFANNTVIVLFSDHGYHLGEKDRVSKHSLWEESTRVPLCVVLPKSYSQRELTVETRCDAPVGLIDIYPTLTEICGLPAKESNEGMSLMPLLLGEETDWRQGILTTYAKANHSLRTRRYRLIHYDDGSEELYDHHADPQEWKNLCGDPQYANLLKRLRKELPEENAPYHPSTSTAPVNRWFKQHLQKEIIKD